MIFWTNDAQILPIYHLKSVIKYMKTFHKILQNENLALRSQDTKKLLQFMTQKDDAMRYITHIMHQVNTSQDLDRSDVRVKDLFDNLLQIRDTTMMLLRQNAILAQASADSYKRIARNLTQASRRQKKRERSYEDLKKRKAPNILVRKFFDEELDGGYTEGAAPNIC